MHDRRQPRSGNEKELVTNAGFGNPEQAPWIEQFSSSTLSERISNGYALALTESNSFWISSLGFLVNSETTTMTTQEKRNAGSSS